MHVQDKGLGDTVTVRLPGDRPIGHGDTLYLTPQREKRHKCDGQGLRME